MVRFVGCGGLAPLLAPGRGTYAGPCGQPLFSAAKKTGKNIEMAANASVFTFQVPYRSGAAVRLLPGSCPVPARFLPGSCPEYTKSAKVRPQAASHKKVFAPQKKVFAPRADQSC